MANTLKELKFTDLSKAQQEAFSAVKVGKSVCITGPGGTGKSQLGHYIIDNVEGIAATSSTGISAVLLGARTLHSFVGCGLCDEPVDTIVANIEKKRHVTKRLRAAKVLYIDEASMIDGKTFDKMYEIIERIRNSGYIKCKKLQYVFVGDFLQLSPISEENGFIFESVAWKKINPEVFYLTEVFRQKNEDFVKALHKIRVGNIDEDVKNLIDYGINNVAPNTLEIKPIILHTHNRMVDEENMRHYSLLKGREETYTCQDFGHEDILKMLDKNAPVPRKLSLRCGAMVMAASNIDVEAGIANGSQGVVKSFSPSGLPIVKFANGVELEVDYETWEIKQLNEERSKIAGKNVYDVIGSRRMVPLRLAYSISVHRSQGQTFDLVRADLSNCFAWGQFYTAMSRVKTKEGLYLDGADLSKIKAHPKALKFYENNK